MKKPIQIVTAIIGGLMLLGIVGSCAGGEEPTSVTPSSASATKEPSPTPSIESAEEKARKAAEAKKAEEERLAKEAEAKAKAAAEAAARGTTTQQNALKSAESYLGFSGFSRQGLIKQLSSEYGDQYSVADATWAVDHLEGVDWNEQAVRSGQSYLDMGGFSRQGLIDQLSSEYGDQYTVAQATYAAGKLGL